MKNAVRLLFALLLAFSASAQGRSAADPAPAAVAPSPRPCPTTAAESRTFAVLLRGNRVGYETSCGARDGSRETFFAYNDRGRGPDLHTRVRFDGKGTPSSVEIEGHDYLKNEIREHFSRTGSSAAWTNKVEEEKRDVSGSAFYVSFSGPPEEIGWLAAALAREPAGRLPLLPAGEARVEALPSRTVTANGKTRSIRLHAVTGLDFQPSYVWLEESGAFFASVSSWVTVIPEGWEGVAPELLRAQEARNAVRRAEAVRRVRRSPGGPLVFTGARLFDAREAVSRPGMTVVVSGQRISAVGADGSVAIPPGAEIVDAKGKTLLPGLFDMHAHPSPDDGMLHLLAGVTSIRDMAAEPDAREPLSGWETGEAAGPRVVVFAGFIDGPGPMQGPTKTLVATEAEARDAVRRIAAAKFTQVKIYSSVKPELVPVIASAAHAAGLRVSGHVPAFMTAEQAVRAGYDEIQHINMLFLNFYAEQVPDTRGPARFTAVAERAATLDLDSEPVRKFLRLLKERGTVVDGTVGIFESMFTDRPGRVAAAFTTVADRLPPQVRRGLLDGGLPVTDATDRRYRDSFAAMKRLLARLVEEGIPVVAGTDSMPGFTLHRELEVYVDAGVPAPKVLQIATLGAARVAGRAETLGSIEPGKLADLVLVEGDPTARISDIRNVRMVVRDGLIYDPARLCAELGIRP